MEALGEDAGERFCAQYGVKAEGNVANDPTGELSGKNVLHLQGPEDSSPAFLEARRTLFAFREKRPRPRLDDKIICGWNGLMISAFAKAYQVLGDESYLLSARQAAHFLKKELTGSQSYDLARSWREGCRQGRGIASDYAFLAQGLMDLFEADFNPEWLDWAVELTEEQNKRFYDSEAGGFFMTAPDQDKDLLLRIKEDMDNVEPSASSVAALNLLRLAEQTGRSDFREAAGKTLAYFGTAMKEAPRGLTQMLVALDYSLSEARQIVIAGQPDAPDTRALLRTLHQRFLPVKTVLLADGGPLQKKLAETLDFIESMRPLGGHATAYVCARRLCKPPVSNAADFEALLDDL